ncbi:MAG: ABC transporter substrate-binding protein [bacterium]
MRNFFTIFAALVICASVSVSVASAQRLEMAAAAQPDVLDPQKTSATSAFQAMRPLYDGLVEVNPKGEIVPALASSWEVSEGGTVWTFRLRSGVEFHDGTGFGPEDVVATFERILADSTASPKKGDFRSVKRIEAVGDTAVRFVLSEPFAPFLASLASGWGAILPSEKVKSGWDFANHPVGTGPFILKEWVRDSHILYRANPKYYLGKPKVEEVRLRFVPDGAVRLQGLLAGEFHIIDLVSASDAETIEADPNLVVVREPSGLVLVAALNNRRPYLNDVRVRRALNHLLDTETILRVAYGGGERVGTFMEVGSPYLPEDIKPFEYDPERAKALLREAGVPRNWRIDLVLPQPYEPHIRAGQMIQDMLKEAGIDARIRIVEWGVWLGEVYRGKRDFDITVIGHTGKLDPDGRLGGYGDPEANYVGYDNRDVKELIERAVRTSDMGSRRAIYAEVLRRMHDDAPFIYIGTPYRIWAHSRKVTGFWVTPLLDTFEFRDARIGS